MLSPDFHQLQAIDHRGLVREAAAGLLDRPARLAPKFLYDSLGSRLFDAITELDEYYPTRTEASIFDAHLPAIAQAVRGHLGAGINLVDLGAGNGAKAARLFDALAPARYVAVDISVDFTAQALRRMQREHPAIRMVGVGLDFSARLQLPADLLEGPTLVFYPGSSIGNFDPPQALRLLREARALAERSALLIGVDLLKDAARLEAAYDDEVGVTAAFNLNMLRHLNRLIGSDFQPRQWRHLARFDARQMRVEMHLEAVQDLCVRWPQGRREFVAGERIHTENAYKWTPAGFESLLRDCGFTSLRRWTDAADDFALFLAA